MRLIYDNFGLNTAAYKLTDLRAEKLLLEHQN